jgi:hypothetical protein
MAYMNLESIETISLFISYPEKIFGNAIVYFGSSVAGFFCAAILSHERD